MKRLLLLIFSIISLSAFGQNGTKVTSSIVPNSFLDNYPTHQSTFGKGGYRSVKTIVERNAIYTSRRDTGMLVYVSTEDKIYILKGGVSNGNWEELILGSKSGLDTVTWTKNNIAITTAGYTYAFRSSGTNTNYSAFVNCYDNSGNPVDARFTKTNNNITVFPAVNCNLDVLIVLKSFSQGSGGGSGGGIANETDPVFSASPANNITTSNINAWNSLTTFPGFGTTNTTASKGDHNHNGVYQPAGSYLTSETDPVYSSSAASGITVTNISNWNFNVVQTIPYTTSIPFTRSLTIVTGKTLTTNDVFTVDANPAEGAGAQMWLDGDGSHVPDFSAFDYQNGEYNPTVGARNLITMTYIEGKVYLSILNPSAI